MSTSLLGLEPGAGPASPASSTLCSVLLASVGGIVRATQGQGAVVESKSSRSAEGVVLYPILTCPLVW